MRFLVLIHGFSYMCPKLDSISWQKELAKLSEWVAAAIARAVGIGPDGIMALTPYDLCNLALSPTIIVEIKPTDGRPIGSQAEQMIRQTVADYVLLFCQTNELPVHPGGVGVLFTPTSPSKPGQVEPGQGCPSV